MLDKLPFHGLGKNLSANWWKALAHQLISRDYLVETVRDMYKTVRDNTCFTKLILQICLLFPISVSSKGQNFLSSCTPDHQPPLYLVVTSEMTGYENKETGEQDEELSASAGSHIFSQAEEELYKMLLGERTKLARARGTAPYAICGDQTLQKIALTRPSTKARLANIDGVNQHLMKMYGDQFLRCIQLLSQQLNLPMDGESCTQSPLVRKAVPRLEKLTPAKLEAWKMWQEGGFTIQRIANYPGRAAPIKEQTVIEYLLEAARDGHPFDWPRFCVEIGLSKEVFSNIQEAIAKVGKEKLKPIKTELPEDVTYPQIKASLLMQELGVEVLSSSHPLSYEKHRGSNVNIDQQERSDCLFQTEEKYHTTKSLTSTGIVVSSGDKNGRTVPEINGGSKSTKESAPCNDDLLIANKRRKSNAPKAEKATESSILSWLENFENGVALADILMHFSGSTKESIIELLTDMEAEFLIFRKNSMYKVM
ncbi:hypothetical protein Leryth_016425 [Lithospermum erythrorhizon]|nr:hypothetical protein Leryth_016425 [Lithospermum erythrorhizon]